MLTKLSLLAFTRKWYVSGIALVFAIVAAAFGLSISHHLGPAGFSDPATESSRADSILASHGGQDTGLLVFVRQRRSPDSTAADQVAAIEREVRRVPLVSDVTPIDPGRPRESATGNTYLVVHFQPDSDERRDAAASAVRQLLTNHPDVAVGGPMAINPQLSHTVEHDVTRAELIGLPLLFVLSLLVFRGLVAAALPPLIGGLTILGTFAALRMITSTVPISVLALNMVTALGLGLAVDYSLFVVSRYREELVRHGAGFEALRATMASAGRTVLYSALTIAAVMASLMIFPQSFLFSMGLGASIVALLSAVASLVVLPAVLVLLGHRVNALAPARLRRSAERDARVARDGAWYRLAVFVMGRSGRIAVAVGVVLIAIAAPFAHAKFVPVDASVLPQSTQARQVDDAVRADGLLHAITPLTVVVPRASAMQSAQRVAALPNVATVSSPRTLGDVSVFAVVAKTDPYSQESQHLVENVRAQVADASVTGPTAQFMDLKASLVRHLPVFVLLVALATLLALFLMTGSIVLGVKTLLMNLLTFASVAGLLVWIFQYGTLERPLGFVSQGALEVTAPILLFAAAFALSTDYGIFLLGRIKEERDNGASHSDAVAAGQERTGRQITAAALLFCFAVGSFATSSVVGVKETTLGIALAVLIDATFIRALLMPALMHLLGSWNWWSPRPLARIYAWIGVQEHNSTPISQDSPAFGDADQAALSTHK
jgi:RND superfamily putative drug exporter